MTQTPNGAAGAGNKMERFRLRTFLDGLGALGEIEVHDQHVWLADGVFKN
jgi:hypothetical protein